MKASRLGVWPILRAFLYPLFAVYLKKGASPRGGGACQCQSPGSQGRSWINLDYKIQKKGGFFPGIGGSLATLKADPGLS
jgi:hypothetical protein